MQASTASDVVRVQVPARVKSGSSVKRHDLPASSSPCPQESRLTADRSSNAMSLSSDNLSRSPETIRRANAARCSYVNAISFTANSKMATALGEGHVTVGGEPCVSKRGTVSSAVSSRTVQSPLPPAHRRRKCLLAAMIRLTHGLQTEERYCFLCNDVFFIAKQKSRSGLRLKQQIPLSEMWVSLNVDVVAPAVTVDANLSFVIGWPMTNLVVTFSSAKHRQTWLHKLERQIEIERDSRFTQSTLVRIHAADKKLHPQHVDVLVSAQEDVSSLISRCCSMWSLEISTMKLWLTTSGHSIPLFGHESPLAIKLNFQKTSSQHSNKDLSKEPSVTGVTSDHDDMPSNCRFVLRPVQKTHQAGELSALQRLLRRPLLSIKLKRENKNKMAASAAPRGLYGCPLTDICPADSTLPKPLMGVLQKLYSEGLYAVGVLRKVANKRRLTEVRERLEAGDDVTLESAVLAGGVLKEFLRSLPECLLTSALYDSWLDAMTIEPTSARLTKIKEMYGSLPAANRLLMQHVFCILYHMARNSDVNKMTSYNLAVCISSSLLWTESISPEDSIRAASLITFLIEHITDIFGDDCVRLLGDPPAPPDSVLDIERTPSDEPTTPDTMHEKSSSLFSSVDSLTMLDTPQPRRQISRSPGLADSGCYSSSVDGDSSDHALSPLSLSLADVTSRSAMLIPRSRSFDGTLDGPLNLHLAALTSLAASAIASDEAINGEGDDGDKGSPEMVSSNDGALLDNVHDVIDAAPANKQNASSYVQATESQRLPSLSSKLLEDAKGISVNDEHKLGTQSDADLLEKAVRMRQHVKRPTTLSNEVQNKQNRWSSFDEYESRVSRLGGDLSSRPTSYLCSPPAAREADIVAKTPPSNNVEHIQKLKDNVATSRSETTTDKSADNGNVTTSDNTIDKPAVVVQSASTQQNGTQAIRKPSLGDVYQVQGLLSVKESSLHLASIEKVNRHQESTANNNSSSPLAVGLTRQRLGGSVRQSMPAVGSEDSSGLQHHHRQLPVPPPYQEAVWRARQLRRGLDPEEHSTSSKQNHSPSVTLSSNSFLVGQEAAAAGRYDRQNAVGDNEHRRRQHSPIRRRMLSPNRNLEQASSSQQQYTKGEGWPKSLLELEEAAEKQRRHNLHHHSHQQQHNHRSLQQQPNHEGDTEASRRLPRTPSQQLPSQYHHHNHGQDQHQQQQRPKVATQTYPEGFWVSRLDTTDDEKHPSQGNRIQLPSHDSGTDPFPRGSTYKQNGLALAGAVHCD